MTSVANEFKVQIVRISSDTKEVYLIDNYGNKSLFAFNIHCRTGSGVNFFFHMASKKLLAVLANNYSSYSCAILAFWLRDDKPMPSADWIVDMDVLMNTIQPQFAEQFASYTLDQIINSSES